MMTKEQAIEYGRAHGCRYLVVNSLSGLLGGFRNLTDAEECRSRQQKECDENPWNDGVTVSIVEVKL